MRNARFWAYVNGGPVKITLRPGQRLEHTEGGPTDEGWSRDSTAWEYATDEPVVYREWCFDGSDCDGRMTRSGVDCCHIDDLMFAEPCINGRDDAETWAGVLWPDWAKRQDHGVYDQFAQAAGY